MSSTTQVLEQADILDVVHAQAVNTTENTKVLLVVLLKYFLQDHFDYCTYLQEGNEEVRKAIQNMASYRVYILFILLVFSFR